MFEHVFAPVVLTGQPDRGTHLGNDLLLAFLWVQLRQRLGVHSHPPASLYESQSSHESHDACAQDSALAIAGGHVKVDRVALGAHVRRAVGEGRSRCAEAVVVEDVLVVDEFVDHLGPACPVALREAAHLGDVLGLQLWQ